MVGQPAEQKINQFKQIVLLVVIQTLKLRQINLDKTCHTSSPARNRQKNAVRKRLYAFVMMPPPLKSEIQEGIVAAVYQISRA